MRPINTLSCALLFALGSAFLACGGGRSQIDLGADPNGSSGNGGSGGSFNTGATGGSSVAGSGGSTAGVAGESGAGGSVAGSAGEGGTGGTTGGVGGIAGDAGTAGSIAGSAGDAGTAGSVAGSAGTAGDPGGSAGTAGTAGTGAIGGTAGTAGTAGMGGTGGTGPDPLACVDCIQNECGDAIGSCLNDPACANGIQCAVTDCLPNGGIMDFNCLLGCFDGDFNAVITAVGAFTCITGTCGSDCGGGLGLGGGFPGGGGGGPFGGFGNVPDTSNVYFVENVRLPAPSEAPGAPKMQQALRGRAK